MPPERSATVPSEHRREKDTERFELGAHVGHAAEQHGHRDHAAQPTAVEPRCQRVGERVDLPPLGERSQRSSGDSGQQRCGV